MSSEDSKALIRRYYELWVERNGKTAVGLTGIPPERFRGVVRFLEAFAAGQEADMQERPKDVPLPVFIARLMSQYRFEAAEGCAAILFLASAALIAAVHAWGVPSERAGR